VPALKYPLLPELTEQIAGNAATYYYRALLPGSWTHHADKEMNAKMARWRTTPLKDLPRADMAWLRSYPPLHECDSAARRTACEWDLLSRIQKDGALASMEDCQGMRPLALLLNLRARLEMAEGETDKALTTFQTALTLARHVGEAPTLINALIGFSIVGTTLDQVEDFVQMPGAPNLYWSLTTLPRPFIDLRIPVHGERLFLAVQCGDLKELEAGPMSPKQLAELRDRLLAIRRLTVDAETAPQTLDAEVQKRYPRAFKDLIAAGSKDADLKVLAPLQVVLIPCLRRQRQDYDAAARLVTLPYWQARSRFAEIEKKLQPAEDLLHWTLSPLAEVSPMVTAIRKTTQSLVRVERRFAALRCIEALRLYAAAHDGKLPARLADITEVPVPLDPVTGKDFEYKAVGTQATLYAPPPEGEAITPVSAIRYELNFGK
jgi:hypothetical protein